MNTTVNVASNSGPNVKSRSLNGAFYGDTPDTLIPITIPFGSRFVVMEAWGGGGGGAGNSSKLAGWGAYVKLIAQIDPSDWDTAALLLEPGGGGVGGHNAPGSDGSSTSITGTLNGVTINIQAGPGGGASGTDGANGVASGGDINIDGSYGNYAPPDIGDGTISGAGNSVLSGFGDNGGDGASRIVFYS